eukprot:2571869-Pleurochrysis_carterae.AAC.1
MALRPSSKMFGMAWCAHVGSLAASSSPRELPCAQHQPGRSSSMPGQSRECAVPSCFSVICQRRAGDQPSRAATP